MKLLLDTHAFLWWDGNKAKLSQLAHSAIEDESNQVYLSVVSIWEIQIKIQLGKLNLKTSLQDTLEQQKKDNNIQILGLSEQQIYILDTLPFHHKDPFDRLLIAQANYEQYTFVADDPLIKVYSITTLW